MVHIFQQDQSIVSYGQIHIAEIKFNSLKEGINMRVYFTFSRVALVLAVVCMAMCMPAGVYAMDSASGSPQVVIAEPTTPANLLNFTEYYETADTKAPAKERTGRKAPVAKAAVDVNAIAAANLAGSGTSRAKSSGCTVTRPTSLARIPRTEARSLRMLH